MLAFNHRPVSSHSLFRRSQSENHIDQTTLTDLRNMWRSSCLLLTDPPSYSQAVKDGQPEYNMSPRTGQASSSAPVSQQPRRGGPTRVVVARRCRTTNSYDRIMVYSLCGFLCCFPLGIAALVFRQKAKNDAEHGRVEDARRNSKIAMYLSVLAVIGGMILGPVGYIFLRKHFLNGN